MEGLEEPYGRDVDAAVTFSGAGKTLICTVAVTLVKSTVSDGVNVAESVQRPARRIVPAGGS